MDETIIIILGYLIVGLMIGVISSLFLVLSNWECDSIVDYLLSTCVLWPVLILTMVIKFVISIPKAVKEYVKFLAQLLIK